MAKGVEFDQQNFVWKGNEDQGGNVYDLPAHVEQDPSGNTCSTTCWQLTPEEKEEVLRTGKVWLHVWGAHPPLCVNGSDPFKHGAQEAVDTIQ